MGNGMNKIMPGLFIGSFRDAKDLEQLNNNSITHIIAIHDNAKACVKGIEYKCIDISDTPGVNIFAHFTECINFIHSARKKGGNVLVHCIAGVSRSCSICSAYIMVVGDVTWDNAIQVCRAVRPQVNPNYGFQKQLQAFQKNELVKVRGTIVQKFGELSREDEEFIKTVAAAPVKDTGDENVNALGTTPTFGNYQRKRLQKDNGGKEDR